MKKITIGILSIAISCWCGAEAVASSVEESLEAKPDARVLIENLSGSVRIQGWEKSEVRVTGTLGEDVEELEFFGDPGYITIDVQVPRSSGRGHWDLDADLEIWVPEGSRLEVETVSASIEADGLRGRSSFDSVSGPIDVSGDLQEVSLSTVSGRIRFDGSSQRVDAETVSGSIRLDGVSGSLEASSVSGRIEARATSLDRGSLESVSGSVDLTTDLAPGARLDLDSHSANVTLSLPASSNASFDLETFSGHIDNELGPDGKRTSKYGPGKRVEFTLGSGDARVTVETFSGNVRLRKN